MEKENSESRALQKQINQFILCDSPVVIYNLTVPCPHKPFFNKIQLSLYDTNAVINILAHRMESGYNTRQLLDDHTTIYFTFPEKDFSLEVHKII